MHDAATRRHPVDRSRLDRLGRAETGHQPILPHGRGTAKTSLVARHDRAEHDADARVGVGALGDGMVPGALASAAHHEEITPTQVESERWAASSWLHEKTPWRTHGDSGHDAVIHEAPELVAVKCHTVATRPVVSERDALERPPVA